MNWIGGKQIKWATHAELNDAVRQAMAEIAKREAMGPVEKQIDPFIQWGWSTEDMRSAFRILAQAIDAKSPSRMTNLGPLEPVRKTNDS